jgi:hypothetical protein
VRENDLFDWVAEVMEVMANPEFERCQMAAEGRVFGRGKL